MTAIKHQKSKMDFEENPSRRENASTPKSPAENPKPEQAEPSLNNPKTGAPSHNLEIAPQYWAEFFASLKRTNHSIRIRASQQDGSVKDIGSDAPLRRVLMEHEKDGCSSIVVIETGEDQEKSARYEIVEPFQLWLENREGDRFGRLQIRAESGTTSIDFHPLLTYKRHT